MGLLLFSIFINDILFSVEKLKVIKFTQQTLENFNPWYWVITLVVKSSGDVMLLGIKTDKKLTFSKHVEKFWHNAQHKLHALQRIRKFLKIVKTKILGNSFIVSRFSYAPLAWMLFRKTCRSKIERIHHKTLQMIYNNNDTYNSFLLQSKLSQSLSLYQSPCVF